MKLLESWMDQEFHGAKAAVFIGSQLLVYQRDTAAQWSGFWDFPGGGRDGQETPEECLIREVREEFGLDVPMDAITWGRAFPAMTDPDALGWFFVVHLPAHMGQSIQFGDEGQRWAIMPLSDVAKLPNLVPALRTRLSLWLRESGAAPI